ncbi:PEP-CTERM sorting domain-containing protein [Chitinimonas sp.]|uniref:PEP-CTERM sorting domain-containing protein n=1 Tax=Chitinimonas sp. TaxID=1934313 RepID=UPI002F92883E
MKKALFAAVLSGLLGLVSLPAAASFVNFYNVSGWTQSLGGGSISVNGAPNTIRLTSSNDGDGPDYTDMTIKAIAAGTVSFNWSYVTSDRDGPSYDPFGWLLNTVFSQLSSDAGARNQSGKVSFNVKAGDVFGFRIFATDSSFGSATATVSNFAAPNKVPEPASLALIGLALAAAGLVRRRR